MNSTYPTFGVAMTPEQYADEWSVEGNFFEKIEAYQWMVQQIPLSKNVLEIGCGDGVSTLTLLNAGKRVLAIEENLIASERAKNRLVGKGYKVLMSKVKDIISVDLVTYDAIILEENFLTSPLEAMPMEEIFDCVVCWNIGAVPATIASTLNKPLAAIAQADMARYREAVHKAVYALGVAILPVGCIVHTVDRLGYTDWSRRDELRKAITHSYQSLAGSAWILNWEKNFLYRYNHTLSPSAIQYLMPNANGQEVKRAMVSLIATKL